MLVIFTTTYIQAHLTSGMDTSIAPKWSSDIHIDTPPICSP